MKKFLTSSALTLASLVSAAQKIAAAATPGEARVEIATLYHSRCPDFTASLAQLGGGLKGGESPQ